MALGIIIPYYKTPIELFEKAIASLEAQTRRTFSVVVVNDGDIENEPAVKRVLDRSYLNIAYILLDKNSGPGIARNTGIDFFMNYRLGRGRTVFDYLYFLDADDMLLPIAVETLYSTAKEGNYDFLQSRFIIKSRGSKKEERLSSLEHSLTWLHGKIYKTDFLKDNNIKFLPKKMYNEDAYFNLVCYYFAQLKGNVDAVTHIWSHNMESVTRAITTDEFYKIHNFDYILSQVAALRKILKAQSNVRYAPTVANIYRAVQQEDDEIKKDRANKIVKRLFKEFGTFEKMKTEEEHMYLITAPQGDKNKLFKQSILNWLNSLKEGNYEGKN